MRGTRSALLRGYRLQTRGASCPQLRPYAAAGSVPRPPRASISTHSHTTMQRNGSCLCRKVQFTTTGEPFSYAVCHCINCKKFSGSAFMANTFFSTDKLTVTAGTECVRDYQDNNTTSGNTLTRSFCAECGSSVFLRSPANKTWVIVCASAFDEPHDWVPRREVRPDCKWAWVKELDVRKPQKSGL
ncbi:Mss4-like protein [Mycena rebaudengoi]|nr:Mss4-like protein [Mycena rebaudengoi]